MSIPGFARRVGHWLFWYCLGGVSFVFVIAGLLAAFVYYYGSSPVGDMDPGKRAKVKLSQKEMKQNAEFPQPVGMIEGGFTIRRTFDPPKDGSPPLDVTGAEIMDGFESYKNSRQAKPTTVGRFTQTARQLVGSKKTEPPRPIDSYHCILKGTVLFVYKNASCEECLVAIPINKYTVTMESRDGPEGMSDGKLFTKRNALVLRLSEDEKPGSNGKKKGLPVLVKGMPSESTEPNEVETAPWYFFNKSNSRMEDWYLALLRVSYTKPTYDEVFSHAHMQWLADQVHSKPDPSGLGWLNAFVGRMFLGVNHTALVEQAIIEKINKKLAMIPTAYIGPLEAIEVNVGHVPPIFSNAMLKSIDGTGEIRFNAHLDYHQPQELPGSGIRITIQATKLGFRMVLAAVIKNLSGDVEVLIKPPPSNRLWWGFLESPKMDIEIEPIVGSRTINWGTILNFIEKQLRKGLDESVVLPNMDDTPFFNTLGLPTRAGVFDEASKKAYAERREAEKAAEKAEKEALKAAVAAQASAQTAALNAAQEAGQAAARDGPEDGADDRSTTASHGSRASSSGSSSREGDEETLVEKPLARSHTAPIMGPSNSKRASTGKKMFSSRPASARKPSIDSTTVIRDAETASTKSDQLPESTSSQPTADSADSTLVSKDDTSTVSEVRSDPASLMSASSLATAATLDSHPRPLTASTLLTAVKARDKTAIGSQVNVARDNVKKWGVNFIAKRQAAQAAKRTGDGDEGHAPASYYGPSDEHPEHHHRGLSLQERLNAAAAAARDTGHQRVTSAGANGAGAASTAATAGTESDASTLANAPSTSTGAQPQPQPQPQSTGGPHRASEVVGAGRRASAASSDASTMLSQSPPTVMQPAPRSMVVPHMPKRPGVPTGIGSSSMGGTTGTGAGAFTGATSAAPIAIADRSGPTTTGATGTLPDTTTTASAPLTPASASPPKRMPRDPKLAAGAPLGRVESDPAPETEAVLPSHGEKGALAPPRLSTA